jgi:methyl-accepting chemotaxis protein
MAMLGKINIGKRLMALAGVMLTALVMTGFIGFKGINDTSGGLHSVYENNTVAVIRLGEVLDSIYLRRVSIVEGMAAESSSAAEAPFKAADQAAENLNKTWGAYTGALTADRKADAGRFEQAWTAYMESSRKTITLAKSGDYEPAMENMRGNAARAFNAAHAALLELMDREEKSAGVSFGETSKSNAAAKSIMLGVLGLGLLLGGGASWFVIRSITGPLARIQSVIGEVERTTDFTLRVDVDGSDEVGRTAAAFNRLLDVQQKAIDEVNGVVGAIAAGDFTKRVEADLKGDLGRMKVAVNASAESVKATLDGLNDVMKALYNGDFNARMTTQVKGEFRLAVDQAMQAMQAMLGDVGAIMNGVAQGNLTGRVKAEGRGDLARLKENVNLSLDALSEAMRLVNGNTRQVAAAANQSSTAIGQISDGAQNQMHAINQVAGAVRQTASSVTDVSGNTEAASRKSQESVVIVRAGLEKMARMVEVVNSIAANSEKIDKITEVIEKIANKTNLLSLNAAIEAARAGEHGKGFAVVAEEVGKLAANSAESTQEIAQLVQQAVQEANRAVETVKEVSIDMERIERGATETDGMLQRISAALEQQSAAVQEINANVANLNKIAESNASASEEITATVVELSKIADNTRKEVEKFSV